MSLNALGLGLVLTAKDLASGEIQKISESVKGLEDRMPLLGKAANKFFDQWKLGMKTFAAGSAAFAGMFALSEGFHAFAGSMKLFQVTTGASADEMGQMHDAAFSVDALLKGFSADEAGEAMARLGNVTNDAAQAQKLLSPALSLARITGVKAADAAEALSNQLQALGKSADYAGHLTDLAALSMQRFGIKGGEVIGVLDSLSKVAVASNQKLDDMVVFMGLAKKGGGDLGKALSTVTGLAAEFGKMVEPQSGPFTTGIAFLGINPRTLQGQTRSVLDVLQKVINKRDEITGDTGKSRFMTERLTKAFGGAADGIRSAIRAIDKGVVDLQGNTLRGAKAVEFLRAEAERSGRAEKLAKMMTGSFAIIRAGMSSIMTAIGEPFFEVFKPIAETVAGAMARVFKFISDIPMPVKKALAGMAVLFSGIVAGIGAFIALKAAIGLVLVAIPALITGAIGAAIVFGPMTIAFAAVVATGAAMVHMFGGAMPVIGSFTNVVEKLSLFWKGLMQVLADNGRLSGPIVTELKKAENEGLLSFLGKIHAFVSRVRAFWGEFKAVFFDTIDDNAPAFKGLVDSLMGMGRALGIISDEGRSAVGIFGSTASWKEKGAAIGAFVGDVVIKIVKFLTKLIEFGTGMIESIPGALKAVGEGIKSFATSMGFAAQDMDKLFGSGGMGGADINAKEFGKTLGTVAGAGMGTMISSLGKLIADVTEFMVAVKGVIEYFKEYKNVWGEIGDAFTRVATASKAPFVELGRAVGEIFDALSLKWEQFMLTLFKGIAKLPKTVRSATGIGTSIEADITEREQRIQALQSKGKEVTLGASGVTAKIAGTQPIATIGGRDIYDPADPQLAAMRANNAGKAVANVALGAPAQAAMSEDDRKMLAKEIGSAMSDVLQSLPPQPVEFKVEDEVLASGVIKRGKAQSQRGFVPTTMTPGG